MVEFTYASGLKMLSQCRHIQGCWNNIGEHVHGTAGSADISNALIRDVTGAKLWQSDAKEVKGKGCRQEMDDLFTAIRRGEIPNECDYAAISTMTAILGRLATYSGKVVKWQDAINSDIQLADVDIMHSLEDAAPVMPDENGRYPIPIPGSKTRFV